MEKMMNIGYPPSINKFRPEQIAQQSTWTKVPEEKRVETSVHVIHIVPSNASTITYVNPLDPGDQEYRDPPRVWDKVRPTSRPM
jgi:hypothetical protein